MSKVGLQQCQDFLMFQSALREMRLLDDKIIHALNTSIPTLSFKDKVNASEQCQGLLDEVSKAISDDSFFLPFCLLRLKRLMNLGALH